MDFNKINIKEIDGLSRWFKHINCVVRIPTFKTKILMGFQIIATIFYFIAPFIFVLSTTSNATRHAKNDGDKIITACCLVFPILIFYFLLTYKKIALPLISSWRKTRRWSIDPRNTFRDPRRPVLLIRSFAADKEANNLGEIIQRTPEEDLAAALRVAGPVITAGLPGEEGLPLLGATRVYFEQNWDKNIIEFFKIANVIVIDAGNTKALEWEMQCVRNLVHPRRVLISFLNRQDTIDYKTEILEPKRSFALFYKSFSNTFQKSFGIALPEFDPNTFLIQFDDNWKPHPIKFSTEKKTISVSYLFQGLSSFFVNLETLNNISKMKY